MGKIEIKIEGRWVNLPMTDKDEWVYDIYHNVSFFRPLLKKWKIEVAGLTKEQVLEYMDKIVLGYTNVIVKF